MSILGKQTLIVKCPACQATTKVNVQAGKLAIRCPRCQGEVLLAFAKKYSKDQPPEEQKNPPKQESAILGYHTDIPAEAPPKEISKSRRQRNSRHSGVATEFSYPDHSQGFVKYAYLAAIVLAVAAIASAAYLYWNTIVSTRSQEYINNVKETVDLHAVALSNIRKALDPLESNDAQKNYREAKGKIDFLAAQRRRLTKVDPTGNAELQQLLDNLTKAEKELLVAEEDVKRLTSQVGIQPVKPEPESVSKRLGSSTTVGPTAASRTEPPKPQTTQAIDDKAVTISIPGISKSQWSDDFAKRFAILADNGDGTVKVNWSGDLLSVEVRPVVDPARYATKINFARLLYYSRNDRIITIEFKPERVNNYSAQGDSITPILIDLKQREKLAKLMPALGQLSNQKVDPSRQAEVAAVLETIASDLKLEATLRDQAIKLLPNWSGRESADLLIRLLDDKDGVVRLAAIDALVETRSPSAATALVKKWDKLDAERISKALITLGSDIEPVVLPYLNNNDSVLVRSEVCRVLKDIGTTESLKPLLDIMNVKDQSPVIVNAAKDAMKSILDRKSK